MFGEPCANSLQPKVLDDVGVLVLVDQDIAEAALVVGEHVRVLLEQPEAFEEQVAEVAGVELLQPLLVGGVELAALSPGKHAFARWHFLRRQAAVLPAVDEGCELPRRPALLVDAGRLDHLLHQSQLIVGIENREAAFQADELGMPAQDLDADRVEGAEPAHAFDSAADQAADALLHLACRLVGEGDGEDLVRPRPARGEDVGDAGGQHPGLAGAGTGQHQHRAVQCLDGAALLVVDAGEVGSGRAGAGAGRNRAGRGGGCDHFRGPLGAIR